MKARLITVFVALTALAAAVAPGVQAGTTQASAGVVGRFVVADAWCAHSGISTGAPAMEPAGTSGIVGGGQWVAFRANLLRWNGARWVVVASSSWKAQVSSYGFYADSWYDYDTRQFNVPGGAFFSILQPGYYAVYYDLYWFPNDAVGSGSTAALAPNHHDLRVGGALLYCGY